MSLNKCKGLLLFLKASVLQEILCQLLDDKSGKSPKADSNSFCDEGGNPKGGSLGITGDVYEPVTKKK